VTREKTKKSLLKLPPGKNTLQMTKSNISNDLTMSNFILKLRDSVAGPEPQVPLFKSEPES
jgi:hypothetical protein